MSRIDLQKLLLVFSKYQKKPDYHFIPYKFGCYSFQANQDLNTLEKYKMVSCDKNNWYLESSIDLFPELKIEDQRILKAVHSQFKNKLGNDLIKHTYQHYPYYAINSSILGKILDSNAVEKVLNNKPVNKLNGLYTIGYEGISLEQYLNKLIKYDIKILCDVRRNALSMKYGFSKSQLKYACEELGIQYIHFPELGIQSDQRKFLFTQTDYDKLFKQYVLQTIPETINSQEILVQLINRNKRVAITCFEADICKCHRLHLAESLKKLKDFHFRIYHI
ncbi:MAG TPA: DUF488 domain-containing protein [Ignavibacteria bacterium]|nr:DUF488 domain-containing protein [Ignavibacteria bacterium]HMR41534.1 DUF488 domain-containing protein [Ignavibacteria bacterium]